MILSLNGIFSFLLIKNFSHWIFNRYLFSCFFLFFFGTYQLISISHTIKQQQSMPGDIENNKSPDEIFDEFGRIDF